MIRGFVPVGAGCLLFLPAAAVLLGAGPANAAGLVRPAPQGPGVAYAWGDDDAGQLGIGTISDTANDFDQDQGVPDFVHMPTGTEVVGGAAGQADSLFLTTAGAVYATGYNTAGELGDNSTVSTTAPVPVSLPARVRISSVQMGYKQSMALSTTGTVYTWGLNPDGQGGQENTTRALVLPAPVSLPARIKAIGAGSNHDLAVTASGAVYAWGLNSTGQLGDGTTVNSDVPVPVDLPAGVTAKAVAGAAGHSLLLTPGGRVYAWGDDTDGQLGDDNTTEQNTPVAVDLPAGVRVTEIAAGDGADNGLAGGYSLALTSTGALYAWGDNASGDLGDDSNTDSDVPVLVQVPAGVTPVEVTAAGDRCHLITATGALYDWGSNEKPGHGVHLVPVQDAVPAGLQPVAIDDGPAAEQYVAIMQGSGVSLATTSTSSYSGAGQELTYSYQVTDAGTTPLSGVSVSDPRVPTADLTCPSPDLASLSEETCTGTYTTTDADATAGSVTDRAQAMGTGPGGQAVTSPVATLTITESSPS